MNQYLVIGKCRTKSNPNSVGGVVMLFEQLITDLKKHKREIEVLDLNRRNYPFPFLILFNVYLKLLLKVPKNDIIFFNGTAAEYRFYSWFTVAIAKLFKKKVILRKFAGDFDTYYNNQMGFLSRRLMNFAFKNADINYFETRYLVDFFKKISPNCFWFPNVRKNHGQLKNSVDYHRRFVFVGHVKKEKGIEEIFGVVPLLPKDYVLDVYGPLDGYSCPKNHQPTFKRIYKGALEPKDVIKVMAKYDVLLLPSYREGYPGVIIEALSLGMPVIATPLQGIKEMVQEGKSGYFVETGNPIDLRDKILMIDNENYPILSKNARIAFDQFDSEVVMKKIISQIDNVEPRAVF